MTIEQVMEYAKEHYNEGGADFYECADSTDIQAIIDEHQTEKQIKMILDEIFRLSAEENA